MKAVFRCDATSDIGFGHLSRCIALAEAFRTCAVGSRFAGLFDAPAREQIGSAGFDCIELPFPVNSPDGERDFQPDERESFLVIDSYRADETFLANLKAAGRTVVLLDDFAALAAYPCDVILNFTVAGPALEYPQGPVLLLGPAFFPARRRLVEMRPESATRDRGGPVRNLLVVVAGSDPRRIAERLVRLLRPHKAGLCLRVIAANDADNGIDLAEFAPGSQVVPRQPDLSAQLLWADACITGGGLIKYECAFMGVPAAAVAQNEGQASETRALANAKLVFDLGLADVRSDAQLADAMNEFLDDSDLRRGLTTKAAQTFPVDPSAHAARAILEAIGG